MNRLLLLTVSAFALAHGIDSSLAGQGTPAAGGGASTIVPFGPRDAAGTPTSPAYMLGFDRIADLGPVPLDPLTTGAIPGAATFAPSAMGEAGTAAEPTVRVAEASKAPAHGSASETSEATAEAAPESGEEPAAGGHRWASERGPMPFDIIRTIQFLQDQVARGNGRAIQVQAMLLRRFGPVFVAADPSVWTDGRNKRAAVLFVLSGGPPEVLRQLMARGVVEPADEPMFKGALAYVENDLAKAESMLSKIDFAGMEPGLEAHLNLVLGQLKQVKAPKDAIPYLDRARLLAPGGLIEEAALRMEMLLVDELGDHVLADHLARQYFDRFSDSSYSANFEARFAAIYASRGKTEPAAAFATMLDVTTRLADANKRAIFLAVGRRALFEGNLEFAGLSAEAALATADIPDADRQRAMLYTIAARIGATPEADAAAALDAIDRAGLHPEDVRLYDAAASVLAGIDRTVDLPGSAAETEQYAETSPVIDRAQEVLNGVADDLGKVQP